MVRLYCCLYRFYFNLHPYQARLPRVIRPCLELLSSPQSQTCQLIICLEEINVGRPSPHFCHVLSNCLYIRGEKESLHGTAEERFFLL